MGLGYAILMVYGFLLFAVAIIIHDKWVERSEKKEK